MDYGDLIFSAKCCDLKVCDECPSKSRTCCQEKVMRELANSLEKEIEHAESAELRAKKTEKIVDEYAESARAIALWLSAFCDKSLSYPQMISNAARKISVAYADMEKRAEKAEKEREEATKDCAVAKRNHEIERNRRKECETRIRELETQHRTEMCESGYDCVQIGKVRKEKAEVEEIASNLCDDFTDFVTGGVYNAAPYCANKRPECVNDRGWCNGDNCVCRGFLPKAARTTED